MPSRASTAVDFSTLGLSSDLVNILATLGYEEPTPVQREAIPLILAGKDVLAQAATGTGKTAAFALPIIQRLLESPVRRPRSREGFGALRPARARPRADARARDAGGGSRAQVREGDRASPSSPSMAARR